ncbi:4Fe-4S binding protein [candidate division KSB1 bacterium]|nr:4Fe-4S binding protein [candidate division KSB1 bacterium]
MKLWRKPFDADTIKIPHGELHIIKERCKGCAFCVTYCPRNVLEMSDEFNSKGYHPPKVINEANCVNCDLCETICPEFAIFCLRKEDSAFVAAST